MTKQEYEDELTRQYNVGISSGLEQAGRYVMKLAKDRFERFGDDHSKQLREIANELHLRSNIAHPGPPV